MSIMKEREFKKHIGEGSFKSLYLIYGDEKYLVRLYTSMLTEKLMGKNPPEFNYHVFNFMNLDLPRLQASILIAPFMSRYNCVKLEDINSDELNAADWNDLFTLLENIPDTTVVIFTLPSSEQEVSKSARFKKLISLAEKSGICACLDKRSDISLEKDLVKLADRLGSKLSSANAGKIIEYSSNNIQTLQNEIQKLASYADGGEITLEMIERMVPKNLQAKVFALADSVIDGKADRAYNQLEILFYQKEKPTAVLSVIGGVYIDAYRAKAAMESGVSLDRLAADFEYKNRAFVLKKAASRASKISVEALRDSIGAVADADLKLKSSSSDKNTALEKLVARLLMIASNDRRTRI